MSNQSVETDITFCAAPESLGAALADWLLFWGQTDEDAEPLGSVTALSADLGVSRRTVHRWLQAVSEPTPTHMAALSQLLVDHVPLVSIVHAAGKKAHKCAHLAAFPGHWCLFVLDTCDVVTWMQRGEWPQKMSLGDLIAIVRRDLSNVAELEHFARRSAVPRQISGMTGLSPITSRGRG